jgi:hypothetical protein
MSAQRILVATTLAGGAFELASAPFTQPGPALLAAALFLAATLWLWRSRTIIAPLLLGLLFAVELAGEPMYQRNGAKDWILQSVIGAVSLVGLVTAVLVTRERIRRRHRERRATATA